MKISKIIIDFIFTSLSIIVGLLLYLLRVLNIKGFFHDAFLNKGYFAILK